MEKMKNEKNIFRIIFFVSAFVFLLVLFLASLPRAAEIPAYVKWLPRFNALINGTCTILLLLSLAAIKKRNIYLHKRLNITCFILSSLFLLSYITFHSYGIETRFPAENNLRPVYLLILLTHIVLAAIVLPLILISFYYGLTMQVEKHRKIVRWSYPVWLYVTVSGVVVYLMISPYYNF